MSITSSYIPAENCLDRFVQKRYYVAIDCTTMAETNLSARSESRALAETQRIAGRSRRFYVCSYRLHPQGRIVGNIKFFNRKAV